MVSLVTSYFRPKVEQIVHYGRGYGTDTTFHRTHFLVLVISLSVRFENQLYSTPVFS